jgi:hypothetical protein
MISHHKQQVEPFGVALMTTKTALFALLAMWGVGTLSVMPTYAEDVMASAEADAADDSDTGFTNRVWTKESDELPGIVRIFLSDGTLVSDSCWETHRLSEWKQVADNKISWNEDGMDINADIVTVSPAELVLKLNLAGGAVEEHYVAATVPYVCPDMPK